MAAFCRDASTARGARLGRHEGCPPAGRLAGPPQSLDFGMRTASGLGPAAACDDAILDDDCTDCGIWPSAPEAAPPERQGQRHEALIRAGGFRGRVHLRAISAA